MKNIHLTLLVLGFICNAQIPSGYYDTATGTGFTLKSQLKDIIKNGHRGRSYSDLITGYKTTDRDKYYENDNSILDIYSENPTGKDPYTFTTEKKCGTYQSESDCYNREHLIPQSFFGKRPPMKSDIHFVVPTDGYVNNRRNRYPFGYVTHANYTSENGSKRGTGNNKGYTDVVFEPIDEFKGDIARGVLYFAVRYEDNWNDSSWLPHTTQHNPMNGTNEQFYEDWFLETMLEWHNNDPVNQREIDRNNAAYKYQGNRNPFIDHPEYAARIWGGTTITDNQPPTAPTSLTASNITTTTIQLNWTASTDNVAVTAYDIYNNTTFVTSTTNTYFNVTGLTQNTNYCFKIKAKDAANNTSNFSNTACETTSKEDNGNPLLTDLFISEYVEGSSYNKAIEIANFTSKTITLNAYSLKIATNGNGFGNTYHFPNNTQLAPKSVYVVTHNNTSSKCSKFSNDTNSTVINFNGNDAIGLFKNDKLIDVVGKPNQSTSFGSNKTLIRKSTITAPNTNYTPSEWITKGKNDCSNLGTHNNSSNTSTFKKIGTTNGIRLVPNPLYKDILQVFPKKNMLVTIYDVLGKEVFKRQTNQKNSLNLKSLHKGVYIVNIDFDDISVTKKLIKQ